MIEELILKYRC